MSSELSATQTAPEPAAIALGPRPIPPTRIGGARGTWLGSTRETVLSKLSLTQVLPNPVVTAVGASPSGNFFTTLCPFFETSDRYGVEP